MSTPAREGGYPMMVTRVDNPLCKHLPSSIDRYTDRFDQKHLRKYRRRSASSDRHSTASQGGGGGGGGGGVWCVEPDEERGCSVSPMYVPSPAARTNRAHSRSASATPGRATGQATVTYQLSRDVGGGGGWAASPPPPPPPLSAHKDGGGIGGGTPGRGKFSSRPSLSPSYYVHSPHRTPGVVGGGVGGGGGGDASDRSRSASGDVRLRPPTFSPAGRGGGAGIGASLDRSADAAAADAANARSRVARTSAAHAARAAKGGEASRAALRRGAAAAQRAAAAATRALNDVQEERRVVGRVAALLGEIRGIKAGPAKGGLECVRRILSSRRKTDGVATSLAAQGDDLTKTVSALDGMLDATATLEAELREGEAALEGAVEALRVSRSLEGGDGGGVVDVADLEGEEGVSGGGGGGGGFWPSSSTCHPLEAVASAERLLLRSVEHRRECKRAVLSSDASNTRLLEKVDTAIRHTVTQEERHMQGLEARRLALSEEARRMAVQADLLEEGVRERGRERDIVCKRLRLRRQRPLLGEDHEAVCGALQDEEAALAAAVEHYAEKKVYLEGELVRLRETVAHVDADYEEKKRLLALDRHLLSLPGLPERERVTGRQLCSGASSAYGVSGAAENKTVFSPLVKKQTAAGNLR